MKVNGEAIYGTTASPFKRLPWGRCTKKPVPGGATLYLHVFDWPQDGQLLVAGLANRPRGAYLLTDPSRSALSVSREDDAIVVTVPKEPPSPAVSVVALEIEGPPDVTDPPRLEAEFGSFVDALEVNAVPVGGDLEVRYTLDGSDPVAASPKADGPIRLTQTATVSARCFRAGRPATGVRAGASTRSRPRQPSRLPAPAPGLRFSYFEGEWDVLPDFSALVPVSQGESPGFDLAPRRQDDHFGFVYEGFVSVPKTGVYAFSIESDDGSRLLVDGRELARNDGIHAMQERAGETALAAGPHRLRVEFFEKAGEEGLRVFYKGPGSRKAADPGRSSLALTRAGGSRPAKEQAVKPDSRLARSHLARRSWMKIAAGIGSHRPPPAAESAAQPRTAAGSATAGSIVASDSAAIAGTTHGKSARIRAQGDVHLQGHSLWRAHRRCPALHGAREAGALDRRSLCARLGVRQPADSARALGQGRSGLRLRMEPRRAGRRLPAPERLDPRPRQPQARRHGLVARRRLRHRLRQRDERLRRREPRTP